MNYKIVVPTGYMGSGSSAVTDLLKEMQGYNTDNDSFEYVFLHCPNGVFDLEDKLLIGNNVVRSDEAIHSFEKCVSTLYDVKNFWPGSYKKRISSSFINYSNEYITSLTTASFDDTYWYYQQEPDTVRLQFINYFRRALKILSFNKINFSIPLKYNNVRISFPTESEFYDKTRQYLNSIFKDLGINSKNLVLDQLLLPHNLYRIDRYFGEEIRVIVVDRDPRDVFVLNKYNWVPNKNAVLYPLVPSEFCKFYRKMRLMEKKIVDARILRISFEDLVYKYDETVNIIMSFLNIKETDHKFPKKYFNPSVSKKNTNLSHLNSLIEEECNVIGRELGDYLYHFPLKGPENRSVKELF